MNRKRLKLILPVAVVVVAFVVTVILVQARPSVEKQRVEPQVPLVRVFEAAPTDLRLNVVSQGTVEARSRSDLVPQVAGRIVSVNPEFASGGFFKAGTAIVQVDPRDYEVAVAQAEAALAQSKTRLAREQAEAAVARDEWLELGQGQPSPLVLRQPQVAEARSAVEAAEAGLMQSKLNLARTTIRAPFDGRILSKSADLGQFVSPGISIATMYATDYAEIALPVGSQDLGFIDLERIGGPDAPRVVLSAEFAGALRRWEGRIVRTGASIDPGSRMLELIARIDRPFVRAAEGFTPLQVGLFVRAEIEGEIVENVFVIPRSALRIDDRVLIVDPESRIHFRDVELVRKTEHEAIVRAGLQTGDRLVLSQLETPVDGMRVAIDGTNGEIRAAEITP